MGSRHKQLDALHHHAVLRARRSQELSEQFGPPPRPEYVWYVAYGSNMNADRFRCYIEGGTPAGAEQPQPGCEDRTLPTRTIEVRLPGGIFFGDGKSKVWKGSPSFYDPALPGTVVATATRITYEQFLDITLQEAHRTPGKDARPVLSEVFTTGHQVIHEGRYHTMLLLGKIEGEYAMTFTGPMDAASARRSAPTLAYLNQIVVGMTAQGHDLHEITRYLANAPGMSPVWTPRRLKKAIAPVVEATLAGLSPVRDRHPVVFTRPGPEGAAVPPGPGRDRIQSGLGPRVWVKAAAHTRPRDAGRR